MCAQCDEVLAGFYAHFDLSFSAPFCLLLNALNVVSRSNKNGRVRNSWSL